MITSPPSEPLPSCGPVRGLVRGLAAGALLAMSGAPTLADTSDARVALSGGDAGDPWQRAMLESWGAIAETAAIDGTVAAADPFTTEAGGAGAQADQLRELIDDGYDAIVVNARLAGAPADGLAPGSAGALDAAVAEACAARIVVVAFDGAVDAPCAWSIVADYRKLGRAQVNHLAEGLPDGGNLLEVRAPEGVYADPLVAAGARAATDVRDGLELVASVRGGRSQEDARRAVADALPGLPPIAGVVTRGGDGVGVAEAFADAGRPVPVIVMGNRHEELAWWRQRREAEGYETVSAALAPGVSTLAFWTALQLLEGASVPRVVTIDPVRVDAANLDDALARTEPDGVTDVLYSAENARRAIADARVAAAR